MKTITKKLGSIALTLCLCFSLCCTAFAASGQTGSITVDGYAGEEYTIYQILDLTYATDDAGSITSYSYTVVSPWEAFLGQEEYKDYFTLAEADGIFYLDPASGIFQEEDNSEFMAAFAKAAVDWAEDEDHHVTAAAGPTAAVAVEGAEPDENNMTKGTVTFSGLNLGYYAVSSSVGTVCSLDTTNPDVTIRDKNEVPVVHKYLVDTDYDEHWDETGDEEDHKKDEGDNKDKMEYKLVVDNVGSIKNLIIHDYLDPDQLDNTTLVIKSIYLYNSVSDTEGTDITASCTLTESTCNNGENCGMKGCSFEIDIPDAILNGESVERDAYIVALYDISLNEGLEQFEDDVDEIDNWVNITFGAKGAGIPEEVQTFSYGFRLYKYTGDIETSADEPLADAKFTLQSSSGKFAYFVKEDGIYLFEGWYELENGETLSDSLLSDTDVYPEGATFYLVTDVTGIAHLDGLHDGTFTLTETEAPEGYNMLKDSITVVITADPNLDSFTLTQDGEELSDHQVNVLNNAGQELPSTGGIGTTIFYIVGGVLVAGAVVVLITRRRMSRGN